MRASAHTARTVSSSPQPIERAIAHSVADDLQAVATAIILASLGLALLHSAGLVTGGTPGLAMLLSHAFALPLGPTLVVVNLPFYLLAWRGMGARFTLKTLAAVICLALGIEAVGHVVTVHAAPAYAAVAGGVLIGASLLVMFRHRASFGGVNILALYLQRRFGWAPGKLQLAVDAAILSTAVPVVGARSALWSLLGAAVVNLVLVWNHRPGRYVAAA